MFKENQNIPSKLPNASEMETIIGPSVKVEGDFVTEGNIVVEGTVCGTIKTTQNLKVGANSKIFADISCENALIAGEIQGNMKINNRLEMAPSAKIFGDIKVKTLAMAPGSILNGKCQMTDSHKSPRPDFSRQEKIELKAEAKTENKTEIKKKAPVSQD